MLIGMAKGGVKGVGMFVVPIMAVVFGGKISSGIVLPMLLMADVFAVRHYNRHANWVYVWKLLPAALAGVFIGQWVGQWVSDAAFNQIIAAIVIGSLVLMIAQERGQISTVVAESRVFGYVFGLLGGFSTMIGNAAGPVLTVYLLGLRLPKNNFIGTGAWFFLLVNLAKLPFHIFSWGTVNPSSLLLNLCGLPALILGFWLGVRIVDYLPEREFRYFVIGMTFVAALRLLWGL